jgi:ubiquinone/menaquinone biosynthesis C-methylase UbiE
MNKASMKEYFEQVAPVWDYWRSKNEFYHTRMARLVQGMVPLGAKVLELGSGTGDLLSALKPSRGVGLNIARELTEQARRKYPHLEFYTVDIDRIRAPEGFRPDYIIMTNMLDYVYDVWDLLESLQPIMDDATTLIITTNNPLWALSCVWPAAWDNACRIPRETSLPIKTSAAFWNCRALGWWKRGWRRRCPAECPCWGAS